MMGRSRKLEREYHQAQRTRRRLRLRVNFGEFGFGAFLAGVLLFGGYLIIDGMRQVPVETESEEEQAQLAAAQAIAEPLEPEAARPAPVDRIPSVTEGKPAEALVANEARPSEKETPQPADGGPVEAREAPPAAGSGGTKALAVASPQPEAPVTETAVPAPVDADAPPELTAPPAGEARAAPREDARMLAAGDPVALPQRPAQELSAPEAAAEAPPVALAQGDGEWFWSGWFDRESKADDEAAEPAPEPEPQSTKVADAQPEEQPEPTRVAEASSEPFWSGWFGRAGEATGDDTPKPAPEAEAEPSQAVEAQPAPEPESSQVAKAPSEPFWSDWFGGAGEAAGGTSKPVPGAEAEPNQAVEVQPEPEPELTQVTKAQPKPEAKTSQLAQADSEPFWSGWFGGAGSDAQQPQPANKPQAEPAAPAQAAAAAEKAPASQPDDGAFWELFDDGDATRVATADTEPFWQAWADAANEKLDQVAAVATTPDEPQTTVEPGPSEEPQTAVDEPTDQDSADRAPSESALASAEAAAGPAEPAPAAADTPEPATATANADADAGTGAGGGAPSAIANAGNVGNTADGADEGSDAPEPEAETVYATFAYGIDNGLPVHEVTYLKYPRLDHGMLYFYSEVDAPDGTTLVHQWRHEGQVVAQQRFTVQGRGARAISYQYIPESARGVWRVYVLDEDGRAIKIGTALY